MIRKNNNGKRILAIICAAAVLMTETPASVIAASDDLQAEQTQEELIGDSETQNISGSETTQEASAQEESSEAATENDRETEAVSDTQKEADNSGNEGANNAVSDTKEKKTVQETSNTETSDEIADDYIYEDGVGENEELTEEQEIFPEETVGEPEVANVSLGIEKYDSLSDTYVALGDETLVLKDESAILTYAIESDLVISEENISWSCLNDLVDVETVSSTGNGTIAITPRRGINGGEDEIAVTVQYLDGTETREITASVNLEVWTGRDVSASVEVSYAVEKADDTARVEVGDTLTACIKAGADSVEGEDDINLYSIRWEKQDPGDADGLTFIPLDGVEGVDFVPTEKGVYRFCASCQEDASCYRVAGTWYSETVAVEPVAVSISFPEKERDYDRSDVFEYKAQTIVTRETTGKEDSQLAESVNVDLALESGDAGSYVGTLTRTSNESLYEYEIYGVNGEFYGTMTLGLNPNAYEITAVTEMSVIINPITISANITAEDKNFDNTDSLRDEPIITWEGDNVPNNTELIIAAGDEAHKAAMSDFVYASVGDVDADTEVAVKPADSASVIKAYINGAESENYQVSVTYGTATIKKVSMEADEVITVDGDYTDSDGKIWFKANEKNEAEVTVKAASGYTVAADLDAAYGDTAQAAITDESTAIVFVKNAEGEIAKVVQEGLNKDKTAPAVVLESTKKAIFDNKNVKETYSIADQESGIADIYYLVTEEEENVEFDESKWEKVKKPKVTEDGKYSFTIKMPKYGYAYVCVFDNVGNSEINAQHILILENEKPENAEFTFETDDKTALQEQKVKVSVKDADQDAKASGIQSIEYKLTDAEGVDVTKEADITVTTGDGLLESDNNIITRENEPETLEQVKNALSLESEFSVGANSKLDGTYTLTITAYDYCGNTSSASAELLLDGKAPKATIFKGNAELYGDNYYYKADNAGFVVTIDDTNLAEGGNYIVEAVSSGGVDTLKKELEEGSIAGEKGTIEFTAEEISALQDGIITVTVSMEDEAGNKAAELEAVREEGSETDGIRTYSNHAEFVLDTKNPEIVNVVTEMKGDGYCGLGDGIVTYSKAFNTTVTIQDSNIGIETLTIKPEEVQPEKAGSDTSGSESGFKILYEDSADNIVITYAVSESGLYEPFEITGTDYAGNVILVNQDTANHKYDKWITANDSSGEPAGGVAKYKKEYESKSIEAEITYFKQQKKDGKVTEEKLDERHRRKVKGLVEDEIFGYYNSTAVIQVNFRNLSERLLSMVSVCINPDEKDAKYVALKELLSDTKEDNISFALSEDSKTTYILRYTFEDEGTYRLSVKGTNASSMPIRVTEKDLSGKEEDDYSDSSITEGNPFFAHDRIVIDKTAPVLSKVDILSEKAVNQDLNTEYGNRYYFNSDYVASFIVKEKYLDKDAGTIALFRAKKEKAEDTSAVIYDNQEQFVAETSDFDVKHIVLDTASGVVFDSEKCQVTFTDPIYMPEDVSLDGVYDYLIYGEDIAGNELIIPAGLENIEKDIEIKDSELTNVAKGFLTNPVVIDRQAPVGSVQIAKEENGTPFYVQSGSAVVEPMQYISDRKAYISVFDISAETTPYQTSYKVNLKNGTVHEEILEDAFELSQVSSYVVKGRQIFTVSDLKLVDLAGNQSAVVPETYSIYLDKDIDSDLDELGPSIGVQPSHEIYTENYGNEGQPLFNAAQDVSFDVKICDPYGPSTVSEEERSSSGIAKVTYGVYAVGKLSSEEIIKLVTAGDFTQFTLISEETESWVENPLFAGSSDDTKLTDLYEKAEAIKVPADVNQNDLIVLVTATDNAKNTKRAFYLFGVDRTAPEITLRYDNQSARNEKYFNADRTAVVTVRDRNFDPDLVNIVVTANAAGLTTQNAAKTEVTDWVYKAGDAANGDEDTWEYKVKFANDGDYEVHIYGLDGKEGILADRAGNTGSVDVQNQTAPYRFTIDKTAPTVSIRMGGQADKEDGHYYYRADNCGMIITYADHGYNIATKGTDDDAPVYSVNVDGSAVKAYVPDGEQTDSVKLSYTAEEIATQFSDGSHTVSVRAVDLAGNEAKEVLISKDANESSCGCEFDGLNGSFILDKTAPKVTAIRTVSDKTGKITDNKVYSDTKSVYYNQNINVIVTVEDEYVKIADYDSSITKNGKTTEKASTEKTGSGLKFTFDLTADNAYGKMTVSGMDKAGNLLVLDENYSHNQASKVDDLKDSGNGAVVAENGKVVDTISPVIRIRYVSEDNANLYEGEFKNQISAYYNKDITAQYRITDNYELDGQKIRVGQSNAQKDSKWAVGNPSIPAAGNAASKDYNATSYRMTKDGTYKFIGYGTDRALNAVKVQEMIPRTDKNPTDSYENEVEAGTGFTNKYVLILDKTNPTYTLKISSPSAKNQKKNSQGNRYYFNSSYTATVTIKETNYDSQRVSFLRGEQTRGNYNTETTMITQFPSKITAKTRTIKDEVSANGVYRYAVYGSDKAGNAFVAENSTNIDGSSTSVVNTNVEKNRGSNETKADTSNHIVIDTVSPGGEMNINNGQSTYYTMLTNGNVTFSEPYRQEQSANIIFSVDSGVERSPVRMTYVVESTVGELSQSGDTGDYQYARNISIGQNGRQQFKVTTFTITDLAGNVTSVSSDNFIYLDMEAPTVDSLAPTINVVANAPGGVRSGSGQPLFNTSVPINITVTDPYGGISSSGLAEIQYDMYINGALVSGDTQMLHGPNTKTFNQNYQDENLDYQYNGTVNVDAGSHNYNDLRVFITATDNSGNLSTAEYTFGIDVTSPSIRVSYDNNNAQNGKYFKENRTATVVVTERNFDSSRINIQTEAAASISDWSHSSGGSANGDDDTWTATISYTADGEYHLSISGADLLGNTATETQYDGVAPTDFVLDKTAPRVTITYDNNDVRNEKYYKADRTATITVDDVNFNGQNNVVVNADDKKKAPAVSFDGKTCNLPFDKDGIYQITGTVTDMAGNVSEPIVDPEFVLDKTLPKLTIEGVKDLSANRDPIKIVLKMLDTNVNEKGIQVSIKGTNNGNYEVKGKPKVIANGVQYTVDTIEKDDYYTMIFTGTDLAGNEVVQKMSFSENQNGTVFVFEQKEVEGEYTNRTFRPSFKLYNVDEVTILSVTLNGREVTYTYKDDRVVLKDNLKSDGKYVITIDAKDAAGNINSMEPVEFYIDRTNPVVTVSGIDKNQKYYFEEFDLVLIHDNPLDEFDKIVLDGKVLGKDDYVINDDGTVTIHINEYGEHELSVVVRDAAGNVNAEEKYEFVLTRNPVIRWYSNKVVFFGSLAVIAALLVGFIILLLKRRKKDEEET